MGGGCRASPSKPRYGKDMGQPHFSQDHVVVAVGDKKVVVEAFYGPIFAF